MMRPLVLTRHCTHRNCHGERNNESIVVMKTEDRRLSPDHHPPPPTNRPQINTKLCWPRGLQTKPASPHITVRGCQEDFFRSETAANFYSVRAWPCGGLTVGRTEHAPEMDWFLVVMQAGNWQQSDGWWNSWPVTVKICSPDQTQSVKMLASRESLVLNSDIKNCKNIIEETVTSIEVNGKWLSSINGAIINYRYHSRFSQNTFFTRETHFNVGRQ